MPTYIYETTDPAKPIRTFEVKQSVHDEPLRSDPETGEGARRVISELLLTVTRRSRTREGEEWR